MGRKKEYPEIGDRKDGHTLVAMGDDYPDQWISWLDALANEYGELVSLLEFVDISVAGLDLSDSSTSMMEFAEALGVDFSSTFWESDHLSGNFQMGWILTTEIPRAKKEGKLLLKQRVKLIRAELVKCIASKLDSLDFEDLVARLTLDPIELQDEVERLKKAEKQAENDRGNMLAALEQRTNHLSAIEMASQECLALSYALGNGSDTPVVAGPLVLWRGEIFVMCSQGGVLPPASPYDDLLRHLRNTSRTINEVHDRSIVGRSPYSGNSALVKGSQHLAVWQNIWKMKTAFKRILNGASPEQSQLAMNLYLLLSDKSE